MSLMYTRTVLDVCIGTSICYIENIVYYQCMKENKVEAFFCFVGHIYTIQYRNNPKSRRF